MAAAKSNYHGVTLRRSNQCASRISGTVSLTVHNLRKDKQADLSCREEAVPLGESGGTVLHIGGS